MFKKKYGHYCLSLTWVVEWLKIFKEGQETMKDGTSSGRHWTSKTDANIILENRSIRAFAVLVGIGKEIVRQILLEHSTCRILETSQENAPAHPVFPGRRSGKITPPPLLIIYHSYQCTLLWLLFISKDQIGAEGAKL